MPPRKRKIAEVTDVASASSSTRRISKRKRNEPQTTVSEPPAEEEKRLARYKPACPQNIRERVGRVMTQRFFMVDRNRVTGELREEFKVLGSTGNVYTVEISRLPRCNCPDAMKGNHCKHILFIFLKVLAVPQSSDLYYQKALLSSELTHIFAHAPTAPNSVSNPHIQAAYSKAVGRSTDEDANKPIEKKRKIEEDDSCPVCYEEMHNIDEKLLVFCQVCGNALHKECFQQWAKTAKPVTCVYCRSNWVSAEPSGSGNGNTTSRVTAEGYLNLGAAAGISPVRDTSSYYRGRAWGYSGDYDDYDDCY